MMDTEFKNNINDFFNIPVHIPFISRKSEQHLQNSKNIFNLCIYSEDDI